MSLAISDGGGSGKCGGSGRVRVGPVPLPPLEEEWVPFLVLLAKATGAAEAEAEAAAIASRWLLPLLPVAAFRLSLNVRGARVASDARGLEADVAAAAVGVPAPVLLVPPPL